MMDFAVIQEALAHVSKVITANRDYLVELDQQNGDGDLGISMSSGYKAIADYASSATFVGLGPLFMELASVFNEAAPSSLGTITSFGLMGMAHSLQGKETATLIETAQAFQAGIDRIMLRAGSKPMEKTILDSLCPAVEVLLRLSAEGDVSAAYAAAAKAARKGAEKTRCMLSKHGRAAYYGEKSLGVIDGGAVVGQLLFEALSEYVDSRYT